MQEKTKKVTMQDVAKYAGVSYQTVSRVLNNSCNVSNQTREKIEKAISQLKYVPNVLAQQLSKQTSNYIGFINVGYSLASTLLATELNKYVDNVKLKLLITIAKDFSFDCVDKLILDFKSQCIDKIIINVPLSNEDAIALNSKHDDVKILFLDVDPYCPVFNVTFNPLDGAVATVKHLKDLGHKNVALINGPEFSVSARVRRKIYLDVLTSNNIIVKAETTGDWTCESGFARTMQILYEHQNDITAILVANDQMAIGAIAALNEQQIKVPNDISVLGYDNTVDSAYSIPSLTTVNLDRSLQCRIAVEKILDTNSVGMSTVLPTELLIRKSSGKPQERSYKDKVQAINDILEHVQNLKNMLSD